jgi:sugar phosphate isomerase/epimerase
MLKSKLPFRIGTTSYIIPDEIVPNVRFLAEQVDDVELVLFEVDNGPNNLPDEATLQELRRLAGQFSLTYTVHLPLDLRLTGEEGQMHVSLQKAKKVIDCTRTLDPFDYVLHLDGRELLASTDPQVQIEWNRQALKSLQAVSEWVGDKRRLAVENLENYPPSTWDEAIQASGVSRCIDIGHLWRDGHDPLKFMAAHLAETRVIHIHGIDGRDHKSLAHIPRAELGRVMNYLVQVKFNGVVTIEVFNEDDFRSSVESIEAVMI